MHLSARPPFRSQVMRASVLLSLAVLSGCDVPTSVPLIDVRWVFPIEETSISVAELLPSNVAIAGGDFVLSVDPVPLPQTLGGLCGPCAAVDGFTVPKPAFNFVYQSGGTLPADVVSAALVSGSVSLALQNGLGFDPIRPATGVTGTMTITIHDVDASGPALGHICELQLVHEKLLVVRSKLGGHAEYAAFRAATEILLLEGLEADADLLRVRV